MAQVTEGIHRVVVILDGPFLSPLAGFFIPEVGVDFTEKARALFPVNPDRAAPDEHRRGGDALPDVVFCIPKPEPPFPQFRLQGRCTGVDDDLYIPVAPEKGLQVLRLSPWHSKC